MTVVEKYFMDKTKNISFIELKKGSYISVNNYIIKDYLPLPMIMDTLIDGIKLGELAEELNVKDLIDGVVYTLGTDANFKYKSEYKELLYNYDPKIEEYIIYKAFKYLKEENLDMATIHFRALTNINQKNIKGLFNYSLCLESIGQHLIEANKEDKGKKFLAASTSKLEEILEIDENYSLAYYKLGYHYKFNGEFLRAKLYWENFLHLANSEERLEEVRKEIELIDDDSNFEQGIYYLNSEEYDLALEKFLKLLTSYKGWGHLHYLIGLAYKGNSLYNEAISFFEKALDLGGDNIDIYNEMGICLYTIGELKDAIKIFSQGLELNPKDYKTIFNRGMINLELGNLEEAKEDIDLAFKLNPHDKLVGKQKERLDSYIDSL